MSWSARARAVLLTLVSLAGATRAARAEPADAALSPPFTLSYHAPPDRCPDADAFLGAIRARTERARIAAPGDETAVAFSVRITTGPAGRVVGRLEIREPDGMRQERSVESATCNEVAQALALVGALYLDPDAIAGPAPPPPPPPPARSSPPPRPPPTATSPRPNVPRTPETAARRAFDIGGGIGGGLLGGIGPSAAPLGRVFGEMALEGEAIDRSLSWARPSARLSIEAATSSGDVVAGSQRYVLAAGTLRLCPVDVAVVPAFHLGPCAAVQAGAHRGTSQGVPNARDQDKPWIAPVASVHASLSLAKTLSVELEGGLSFPLVKTRFFLGPDVTLFRAPVVAATATAAVTAWFR